MRCRIIALDVNPCCQGIGTNAEYAITLRSVVRASGGHRHFLQYAPLM